MSDPSPTITNFQIITGSIALYNCLELCIMIYHRFKRYRSLYFYTMTGSTLGTALFTVGFFSLFFNYYHSIYLPLVILTTGWYAMVTGFSLILYSRLHVIQTDLRIKRGVAIMIGLNVICNHFPTTVLTFGSNVIQSQPFVHGYSVMEKIQMTFFWLQESTLTVIYLYYTYQMLSSLERHKANIRAKRQIMHTVWVNLFVLMLDLAALVFEYSDMYDYQIMFKALLYSIKIKCEFIILNHLSDMLIHNHDSRTKNHLMIWDKQQHSPRETHHTRLNQPITPAHTRSPTPVPTPILSNRLLAMNVSSPTTINHHRTISRDPTVTTVHARTLSQSAMVISEVAPSSDQTCVFHNEHDSMVISDTSYHEIMQHDHDHDNECEMSQIRQLTTPLQDTDNTCIILTSFETPLRTIPSWPSSSSDSNHQLEEVCINENEV